MRMFTRSMFLTGILLAFPMPLWAGSVGVAPGVSENRLNAEVVYHHLFDRDLDAPAQETDELTSSNQVYVHLGYALADWCQPYAVLGWKDLEEELRNVDIAGVGRRDIELEYEGEFSGGFGLRGTISLDHGWFVGYDGRFLMGRNDLDRAVEGGEVASAVRGHSKLTEWQGAGYAGCTLPLDRNAGFPAALTFYAGARYSDLRLESKGLEYDVSTGTTARVGRERADDKFGIFAGAGFQIHDSWRIFVEGHFLDETAVSTGVSVRF